LHFCFVNKIFYLSGRIFEKPVRSKHFLGLYKISTHFFVAQQNSQFVGSEWRSGWIKRAEELVDSIENNGLQERKQKG
jgi:hypothetical protein